MLNDEYIDEVMDSGDRVPVELWDAGLSDVMMQEPVFDGEKIIDLAGGEHGA